MCTHIYIYIYIHIELYIHIHTYRYMYISEKEMLRRLRSWRTLGQLEERYI